MKILNKFIILTTFLTFNQACSGSGGSGTSSSLSEEFGVIYSDDYSLAVTGANSHDSCTVTGSGGRELGRGTPDSVTYNVGLEQMVIVQCGDLKAITSVGTDSVTLSQDSTDTAETFEGLSLQDGTELILNTINQIDEDLATEENRTVAVSKNLKFATGSVVPSTMVSDSLVQFITARDNLSQALTAKSRKQTLISLLINTGEAVVVTSVGGGGSDLMTACTDAAASIFSQYAVAVNATTVGMTGCLVYHSLDAVTDLNNPLGAPANNIPASFRSIVTESGVLAELFASDADNRMFTLADVRSFLFSSLGYTAYTEDDEGTTTSATVATTDLDTFYTSLLDTPITSLSQLNSDKYHTGYNPSGGWEINAAATLQTLDTSCTDSLTTTTCSVSPLKFNFDGTTLTQNNAGSYILQMRYSNGSFLNEAKVINASTSKPYRDTYYRPVTATITASNYSAIDYANPLYQSALNPMKDSQNVSAPYSNAEWKADYPNMSNVDNTYRFPNSEVAVKLILLLQTNQNLNRLSALQAYALAKLTSRGLAAIPLANGNNAILNDHAKTLAQWSSLATTFLQSGSSVKKITATGGMDIQSGVFTIKSATCKIAGVTVTCTITENLTFNRTGTAVSNGTNYAMTGTLNVTNSTFGNINYSPTTFWVSTNGKSAAFLGADDLTFTFTGSSLKSKVEGSNKTRVTYSLTALTSP